METKQKHIKMFSVISYQENANQNSMEILSHPHLSSFRQENTKQQMLVKVWEEEPVYTAGGSLDQCSHRGNQDGHCEDNWEKNDDMTRLKQPQEPKVEDNGGIHTSWLPVAILKALQR